MGESHAEHRRRDTDGIAGQIKALWPVLVFSCLGYAAWEGVRVRATQNSTDIKDVAADVVVLKQVVAVQTAMLTEIKDTVKDIAKSQRRRRDE